MYARHEAETAPHYRARITEAYERLVGPMPEHRVRGRVTPLRVEEAARIGAQLEQLFPPNIVDMLLQEQAERRVDPRVASYDTQVNEVRRLGFTPAELSNKATAARRAGDKAGFNRFFALAAVARTVMQRDEPNIARNAEVMGPFALMSDVGEKRAPPSREQYDAMFARLGVAQGVLRMSSQNAYGWSNMHGFGPGNPIFAPGDYARFYSIWSALQADRDYEYGNIDATPRAHAGEIVFELQAIPDARRARGAGMWDGAKNCALELLSARFANKAKELSKIQLAADGGFYQAQAFEVAKILKRNVRVEDRCGGAMYKTTKPDGSFIYNGRTRGVLIPPVVIVDFDQHAVEKDAIPQPDLDGELVVTDSLDFFAIKAEFGNDCRVWHGGESTAFVEASNSIGEKRRSLVLRKRKVFEQVEARAHELGVENFKLTASPFGVEAKVWRNQNGFHCTPSATLDLWKAAQFYPVPYCSGRGELLACGIWMPEYGRTIDLNHAYESAPRVTSRALFEQYGFPMVGEHGNSPGFIIENPPIDILQKTGLVVVTLDLEKAHPWVRFCVRGTSRGVYTTMRIASWLAAGAIAPPVIELAVITAKHFPELARPDGALWCTPNNDGTSVLCCDDTELKRWGAKVIGRLVPSVDAKTSTSYVYIIDDAEAASVINTLREANELQGFEHIKKNSTVIPKSDAGWEADFDLRIQLAEGVWKIGRRNVEAARGSFHTYAYFLDYCACAVDAEIFKHPWETVLRIKTDSITLAVGEAFSAAIDIGDAPGQWKYVETSGRVPDYPAMPARAVPELPAANTPYWEPLFSGKPVMVEKPPGYGKTTLVTGKLLGTDNHVILTPTRKMRRQYVALGHKAYTWQWALKPGAEFRPELVRIPWGSIVYIMEVGVWDGESASLLLPWLVNHHGCIIVMDGDRKQMKPVVGTLPWTFLDGWATTLQWDAKDWRSKDEGLAEFKLELRTMTTNREVFKAIAEKVGADTYASFLEQWHPRDFVYAAIHDVRNQFHKDLARVHREKYPAEPLRIRYSERSKERSGEEEFIALTDEVPATADIAYTTTYSSCQGETASAYDDGYLPKIWLVTFFCGEHFENAAYVAATRNERFSQLRIISGQLPDGVYHGRQYADGRADITAEL